VLNATKAVATVLNLAKGLGAQLQDREPVVSINAHAVVDSSGTKLVAVTTKRGVLCMCLFVCVCTHSFGFRDLGHTVRHGVEEVTLLPRVHNETASLFCL
jgi:hypothetical protein